MAETDTLICGDIGGTKTILQLAELTKDGLIIIAQQRYQSADFNNFNQIISSFLSATNNTTKNISAACFGVAGPVIQLDDGQNASITNLPWLLNSKQLSQQFGFSSIRLINDFEAVGFGLDVLSKDDLVSLQTGDTVTHGNKLIIGAGTGLGLAHLVWQNDHYQIIATEAGHMDYAAADEQQLELSKFLIKRYGRSSMEFVLSGPGLINIYDFLSHQNQHQHTAHYKMVMASGDPAAEIAQLADHETDPVAVQTMALFVRCYGSQAGNFALASLALGGVYVAGGIAPKIIDRLQGGAFIKTFIDKGKMAHLLETVPVNVVMNPEVGLLGSRVVAQRIIAESRRN